MVAEATNDFDYIVVGAGSAGCAAASRLSENKKHRVLLLEAGPADSRFWIQVPLGVGKLIADPNVNWCLKSEPEPNANGRSLAVPRGKVIGGSSSINGNVYVRGTRADFDSWAASGCAGWSYRDVLPYFRRMENFERGGDEFRGYGGPLNVSDVAEKQDFQNDFLTAAESVGIRRNTDTNGATPEGVGYAQTTIRSGLRHSAAAAFLRPVRQRPNLKIISSAHVTRVLTEQRRAIGVAFLKNGISQTARARRETILCAGTVHSPSLLELSGIGDGARLQKLGIAVISHLPGVGENLQEHFAVWMKWRIEGVLTLNERLRGCRGLLEGAQFLLRRQGALTLPACTINGFIKTSPELPECDVQLLLTLLSFENPEVRKLNKYPGATITVVRLNPESRGSTHITSTDPLASASIRFNAFTARSDVETIMKGIKMVRRIATQQAIRRYRPIEIAPGSAVSTNDELADWIQRNGNTCYHLAGTCRMGQGSTAVVDPSLRVIGIENLRVADASVMPNIVSGNTHATAVMIGQRVADFCLHPETRMKPLLMLKKYETIYPR